MLKELLLFSSSTLTHLRLPYLIRLRQKPNFFVSEELYLLRSSQATCEDSKYKTTNNNEVAYCAK